MPTRDIWIMARFELLRHLRSLHGLLGVAFLVLACGFLGYRIASYSDQVNDAVSKVDPALVVGGGVLEQMTELPLAQLMEVLAAHPPMLVLLFAGLLGMIPMLTFVFAYDQTASEIETRHVRYLLFRSDRRAIFLGKWLGAYLIVAGAATLALLTLGVFIGAQIEDFHWARDSLYLLRIWGTVLLLAVPYVSFLGLLGAVVGRARRVPLVALGFWTVAGILAAVAGEWIPDYNVFWVLFPTVERSQLLGDSVGPMVPTLVHLVCFSATCIGLGLWRFQRRDL